MNEKVEIPQGLEKQYAREMFYNRMVSFINGIEYGLKRDGKSRRWDHMQLFNQAYNLAQAHTIVDTGYKVEIENLHKLSQTTPNVTTGRVVADNMKISQTPLSNIQRQVVANQIPTFVDTLTKLKSNQAYAGVSSTIDSMMIINEMMPNQSLFVKQDLYASSKDIGIFDKRLFGEEFYQEHTYAQVNEAVFQYNEGRVADDAQGRKVVFANYESEFQKFLMEDIGLKESDFGDPEKTGYTNDRIFLALDNVESDPAEFRFMVRDLKDATNRTIGQIKSDREKLKQVKNIIDASKKSKTNLRTTLDSFDHLDMVKDILEKIGDKKPSKVTNKEVLTHIRSYVMNADGKDTPNMQVPVYMSSSVVEDQRAMRHSIDMVLEGMKDPANEQYHQYQRALAIRKEHSALMNTLYDIRNEANADGILYINTEEAQRQRDSKIVFNENNVAVHRYTDNDKSRRYDLKEIISESNSVFDPSEAANIYEHSNRLNEMHEKNDAAAARSKESLAIQEAEGRAKPQQPMNRFRNAFASYFVETGSEAAKQASEMTQMDLEMILSKGEYDKDTMGHIISESGYNKLLEAWDDIEKRKVITYTPKERNERSATKWEQALENNERIRLKGSEVGYRIQPVELKDESEKVTASKSLTELQNSDAHTVVSSQEDANTLATHKKRERLQAVSNDGYVTLEREHILVEEARIKLNVEEAHIKNILERMNERRRRSQITQEEIREKVDKVHEDAFINLRYKQEHVSEELAKDNPYLYEKLSKTEQYLEEKGLAKFGVVEENIPALDIENQFNVFRKNLSELDDQGIKQRKSLPLFLLRMAESHAPWMMDDTSELVGTSELALRDTIQGLAKENATIDLTDEGLLKEWDKYAKIDPMTGQFTKETQLKRDAFIEKMGTRNLSQRLEDHLFLKVLGNMVQENFASKGSNGGVASLLRSAAEMAEQNTKRGVALEVHSMLQSDVSRALYNEHGYYEQALSLSPKQIETILRERDLMDASLVSLDHISPYQVDDYGAEDYWEQKGVDIKEELDKERRAEGDAYIRQAHNETYENRLAQAHGNPLQTTILKYGDVTEDDYKGGLLMDEHEIVKRAESKALSIKEEELTQAYKDEQMKSFFKEMKETGVSFKNLDDVHTMLDVAESMENPVKYIEAEIQNQPAYIYRGKQGDVIAHLLHDNVRVELTDSSAGMKMNVPVDQVYPQKLYGESEIKVDIGDGGAPVREQYTSYDTLQGSGKYARSSNPAVTLESFQRFLKGQENMTYLDIETTGLSGSTLPEEVIQPIEVHMQKVQWDTGKQQLRMDKDTGEFTVKHAGRESVREQQLILGLKDETKSYINELIADEHFQFKVGDQFFDIVDYENDTGRINSLINKSEHAEFIHREILEKRDKMWLLRNVAKYAFVPGTETDEEIIRYRQYAGNDALPTDGRAFINQLKADVQTASNNLDSAVSGKRGRVSFSDVQVGTTEEGMLKHVSKFVGKGLVAGQNIADADWSKFTEIADDLVAKATVPYHEAQNELVGRIDEISRSHANSILNRMAIFASRGDMEKHGVSEHVRDAIAVIRPEVDSGAITSTQGVLKRFSEIAEATEHNSFISTVGAMTSGTADALNGTDAYMIQQRVAAGKEIDMLRNAVDSGDMTLLPDWAKEGRTNRYLGEKGIEEGLQNVQSLQAEAERVQRIKSDMPVPKMVEQMYLYNLVNPDAKGRSAEVQFEHMNVELDTSAGLHMARADVRNNLQLINEYGKALKNDEDFMKFAFKPLQQNDVIELHTSFDKRAPRGIYQVGNVDLENHSMSFSRTLDDGTSEQHVIHGSSNADLSRRVNNHFSFVGETLDGEGAQDTIERFSQDQARRQADRAMRSADVFEKYQSEINQLAENPELTHQNLRNMQQVYEGAVDKISPSYGPAMNPNDLSEVERIAVNPKNAELFEGNAVIDALDEKASPTKRMGFDKLEDFLQSPEGQARQGFLNEVRSMQASGAIDSQVGGNLIKQWNEALKEEGLSRGAKHSVLNKANLGTLDGRFGYKQGNDLVIDTSSPSRISSDLWRLAEGLKGLTDQTDETKGKEKALNSLIFPYLKENGYIKNFDPQKPPSIMNVANQIMKNRESLPGLEEYDAIASAEKSKNDIGYQEFLEQKKEELLQPHREAMTEVQRNKQQNYERRVSELKEQGLYDPRLTVEGTASGIDVGTARFGRNGGIGDMQAGELKRMMDAITTMSPDDVNTRNTLAGELFHQATLGQRFNVQDVIDAGHSNQLEAMKALNWVTPDNKVNENVATHIFGVPGKHAAKQMGELSDQFLNDIAEKDLEKYTRDNNYASIKNKVENWKGFEQSYQTPITYDADGNPLEYETRTKWSNGYNTEGKPVEYPGRFPTAPKHEPRETYNTGDALRESNEATKAAGREAGTRPMKPTEGGDNVLKQLERVNLDPNTDYQHTNAISDSLRSMKEKTTNMASELWHGEFGKATKWVAGIGAAAFAINQFMNAGSPIKLDRKPMGHGVEGATGQANDGLQEPKAPNTGGKTYVNSGENKPPAGYEINVSGQANGSVDYDKMQKQIDKTIGNFNTNINDNRETFNRSWLEKQFGDYIDRGYVGEQ